MKIYKNKIGEYFLASENIPSIISHIYDGNKDFIVTIPLEAEYDSENNISYRIEGYALYIGVSKEEFYNEYEEIK